MTSATRLWPTMVVVLLSYLSFHQGLTWHVISMWLIPHPISKQILAARQSCSFWLNASNHYAVPPEGSWSVLRECLFLESFLLLSWKQPHCMLQTESWVTQVLVLTPHSQCDGIWRDFGGGLHMTFCLLWIGCCGTSKSELRHCNAPCRPQTSSVEYWSLCI